MTDLETYLREVEARANGATEGPWVVKNSYYGNNFVCGTQEGWNVHPKNLNTDADKPKVNALFIAHARTDIPKLVAMVREERHRTEVALNSRRELFQEYERVNRYDGYQQELIKQLQFKINIAISALRYSLGPTRDVKQTVIQGALDEIETAAK